jgi:hypothetical protein
MSVTNDGTLTTSNVNSTDMFSWRTVPPPSRKRAVVDANANTPQIKRSSRDPRLNRSAIFTNDVNTAPIETNNRFGVLSSDDSNNPKSTDPEPTKTTRPPPIRLQCELSYIELTTYLTKLVGEGNYRCTATTQGVSIYPAAPEHYRQLVHSLRNAGVPFHTYQLQEDKAFRVVIRGLHPSVPLDEISQDLTRRGYRVRQVTNVLSREKANLPLFFVDLEPDVGNANIFKLNSMLYSKISVEEPRQSRQVAQCKRCQRYGHTKNFCTLPLRCVRCGDCHASTTCVKPRSEPAKCANCDGSHPASYRGCGVHRELQNRRSSGVTRPPRMSQPVQASMDAANFPPLPTMSSHNCIPTFGNMNHHRVDSVSYSQAASHQSRPPPHTSSMDTNVASQLSTFLTEIRNVLTPVLNMMSQLLQVMLNQHGRK